MTEITSENPLRAGNLGRVSHDRSGRDRSVAEQHDLNLAEITRHAWVLAATYEDSVSASRFARAVRTDWPRLQADIEAGRLDVVVLWEPARGSREPEDWFAFLRRCRDNHVLIHVTSHKRTYDISNPRDWRTMADDGVDAAYDSEKKSRDIHRALHANAEAGRPHGPVTYGYRRIYDPRTGQLNPDPTQEPDPVLAAVPAEIIVRVAALDAVSAIRKDLDARGLPSPRGGRWHRSVVRSIAMNVAYIGKRRVDGRLVDATWPPISDDPRFEAQFWAAQTVLAGRPGAGKATRPGGAVYLLSWIMTCDACGSQVCGQTPNGCPGRLNPFYLCAGHHCASIGVPAADEWVTALIITRCADYPELLAADDDSAAVAARAEAARLGAELDEWVTSGISARAYAIKEAELLPKIKDAERRAEQLAVPPAIRALVLAAAAGDDKDAREAAVAERWAAMPLPARREVVRDMFDSIILKSSRVGKSRISASDRIGTEWSGRLSAQAAKVTRVLR